MINVSHCFSFSRFLRERAVLYVIPTSKDERERQHRHGNIQNSVQSKYESTETHARLVSYTHVSRLYVSSKT